MNSTLPAGDIPAGGIPAGGDEGLGGGWGTGPDDDEEEDEGWSGGYEAPPEWWRGSEFARKLRLVQRLWRLAEEHGWDTAWVDALIARIWADARMNVARLNAWLEFLRARSLYACWPQNPDKSYLREMAKFLAHNPDVPMPPDISEDEWRELFAGPDEWRPDWLVAWAVRNQNMNIEALIEKILGGVIFGGTIKTLFAAAAKEGGTTLVAAAPAAGQAAIFGGLAVYISFGGKALVARVILLIDDASALPPSDGPSDTIDPSWDYPGCPWREPLR